VPWMTVARMSGRTRSRGMLQAMVLARRAGQKSFLMVTPIFDPPC
jgi:hypothetical protein